MFSDTHFHFKHFVDNHDDGAQFGAEVLTEMTKNDVFFGLDVGTKCDDLFARASSLEESLDLISDHNTHAKAQRMLYLSAGIWPDVDSIHERESRMETLRETIEEFREDGGIFSKKLVAIGEGGIDHHWNPDGADGRDENDFDRATYEGEKELFEMQLLLAKELNLPFIVHSRDGFEDTVDSIKNIGYNCGIIHCYSYGLSEARTFLDLGWHLAFGGGATYTKKAKMDEMNELLAYVPDDRILMETDSPYLAPVPLRGSPNNPNNIRYSYEFVAVRRNKTPAQLSKIVDKNIKELFKL